jgi:ABC transport system ATP-binding/permease protein
MTNPTGIATVIADSARIDVNNQGRILSFNLTGSYHVLGRETRLPPPEGLQVPEDWLVVSRTQACFRKKDNAYYIYDGDGERASSNRLYINNTVITPKEGYRLQHGDEIKIGQNPQNWITIAYAEPRNTLTGLAPKQRAFSLREKSMVIGRGVNADIDLEAPIVSRRHAIIDKSDGGRYHIRDLSTNGIFVNRQKVSNSALLSSGDLIQVGPYTFVLRNDTLILVDSGDNIRIDAKNIVRFVRDKNKQKLRLLNDISLAIEPGQFVALVGGSGAGKSTLMKTLLGIEPNTEGTVYLNGDNLKTNFNIYRTLIGYVPQYDIVHTNLKVKEVLYYAAKLRLPPDINVEQVVQKTLQQIELLERQNTLVKNLSGGQLKRVSIGVELLADPKLFFLDEPTSGLDPGLDKKMMQLLRRLADEGRTVILVTHATTNITLCDRIVFMGLGGHLCYFGPPDKAMDFFKVESEDFADIYIKLETKESVLTEAGRFHTSDYQKEYIDNRLAQIDRENQFSPKPVKRSFFQQLAVLTQRYVKLICRDPVYLTLVLLTAPIAIVLIAFAVQGKSPLVGDADFDKASLARRVLFVFTCAAMWVGFVSSLQEIVKESAIYLRERLVNLGLLAYLGSKVVTLGGLALLQSLLITIVVLISFKSPDVELYLDVKNLASGVHVPWSLGVFVTTFLTLFTSSSMGLMVSAIVKNGTQANSALPLLLLPQIIFSGILFDLNKGIGEYVSWLMLGRWSVGAYGILADINILVPGGIKDANDNLIQPVKRAAMFYGNIPNLLTSLGILLLHGIVYLVITLWLQKRKDIFK